METALLIGLLASGVRFAIPLLLAAVGETVSQRAGVLNVGIEGVMLVGALAAVLCAVWTGSPWLGLLGAIVAGVLFSSIHVLFAVILRADQIVSGIALFLLGIGLSGFVFRLTLGSGARPPGAVPGFRPLDLGPLSEVPVLGPVLFQHNAMVYLAVVAVAIVAFVLARTGWGLTVRAVGENPLAVRAAGLNEVRLRAVAVLIGGGFAGAGGAFLSIAQLNGFVENMVAGRGFIAIACVVFGRWNPVGVAFVALAFGITEASQIRLQTLYPALPHQFFVILPYVAAIVALVILRGRSGQPAALGR
jgi:general nucleoside transport system permease protein